MEHYKKDGVSITAAKIELGERVSFGKNVHVNVRGIFRIGDGSRIGDNAFIEGRNIEIGSDLWSSSRPFGGLTIGRGRRNYPDANLTIGDRCTIHNNSIDLTKEVRIGDDVGLSPEVAIYTHGYWLSALEGFPFKFGPVTIENGVIVGYRSLILMGVTIGERAVIGAHSVVTRNLPGNAIYAGNPAKRLKNIVPPPPEEKERIIGEMLAEYRRIAEYRGLSSRIVLEYPVIRVNRCRFNVETLDWSGDEDEETDDFRDFVFKFGLRFFTERPFRTTFRESTERGA